MAYPSVPSACNPFIPKMKPDTWCTHEIRGFSLKLKQVQARISKEHCFVWVKYGETFRDATFAEAAQMRKEQVKDLEPLAHAEIPGLRYTLANRKGFSLVTQTHFMNSATHDEKCKCSDCKRVRAKINDLQFCLEHASCQ